MVSGIGTGTTKMMDLHDEAGLAEDQMDVVVGGLSVPGGMTKKQPKDSFDQAMAGATDHIDKHPTDPKSIFSQAEAELEALKGKGHAIDPKLTLQQAEAELEALKGKGHANDPKLTLQQAEAEADALKSKDGGTDTKAGLQQSLDDMIQQDLKFIKDMQDAKADQMSKISRG